MQDSAKNKPNSKDLPEVYVLKKEVQFEIWRHAFADVCHALGIRKILNTTPAVRNKTAKREASHEEMNQKLKALVKSEPKQPQMIKLELPDMTGLNPEDAIAALKTYRQKLETAQNSFENLWINYLKGKREHEAACKQAERDLEGVKHMDFDEDVMIIKSKTKRTGGDKHFHSEVRQDTSVRC